MDYACVVPLKEMGEGAHAIYCVKRIYISHMLQVQAPDVYLDSCMLQVETLYVYLGHLSNWQITILFLPLPKLQAAGKYCGRRIAMLGQVIDDTVDCRRWCMR